MIYKVNILFLFLLFSPLLSFSQDEDSLENQTTYHRELSASLFLHTHGYGVNFRKAKHVSVNQKRVFEIDWCSMNHPKNYVFSTSQISETKRYTYGELNSVSVIRVGYGNQKLLAGKTLRSNVEIRFLYLGGLSLAFLKPVYYELYMPGEELVFAKYNNETKNIIRGGAGYAMGFGESAAMPGVYGKSAVSFEYASKYNYIRALETGFVLDIYYKDVPILAETKNYPYFISFYVGLTYGKKWYR